MAVQQNKKSPSKRGMHRAHDRICAPALGVELVGFLLAARENRDGATLDRHLEVRQAPLAGHRHRARDIGTSSNPSQAARFPAAPRIQERLMAVQQNKKSPSKRGMHRSHNALTTPGLALEPTTGETHLRHHISPTGFYRGRKVVKTKNDA